MELKLKLTQHFTLEELCLNRTFMELKLVICVYFCVKFDGLNRTFMELKLCELRYVVTNCLS